MKLKLCEISKRRDEWLRATEALQNQSLLLIQREELEKKIHQLGVSDELKIYKQELLQIDHLLDESEELTESCLYAMQEELCNACEEQKLKWNAFKSHLILEGKITNTLSIGQTIQDLLNTILQTRSTIKGKGLLNYIFGISPNAIIERHLLEIKNVIEQKLPELDQTIHREMYETLIELKDHCSITWGFRHIDTSIVQSNSKITNLCKLLEEELKETLSRKNQLKNDLDYWLINY